MKNFVTTVFLIFAAILLVSPQAGLAYQTLEGGCLACHKADTLHTIHTGQTCTICHPGAAGAKPIPSSNCVVCHPRTGDKGVCPLINTVATHPKSTCLTCHTECAPVNTTTTTAPTSTTTTTPAGPCPAEAVLGEDDPRLDTLRAFRDQVLAKNPNGQKMIKMYYDASAAVVQMMDKDPELRESARKYLESIMPTIEMMVKQKASRK
jgi:hypothetical protein